MTGTSTTKWQVQAVSPRDWFDTCTLTIEQWLANTDVHSDYHSKTARWLAIMEACALVLPGIDRDGLRQPPRIGFDPIRDQMYFIFKASNNGTTFLVSKQGIDFDEEEAMPLQTDVDPNDLSPARCRLDLITVDLPPPKGGHTAATGRLMAVSDGYDSIGVVWKHDDGNAYSDRVNIGCPACGAYVLILASDYKYANQIRARCLAGCSPERLSRAIVMRVTEGRPGST